MSMYPKHPGDVRFETPTLKTARYEAANTRAFNRDPEPGRFVAKKVCISPDISDSDRARRHDKRNAL